MFQPIDSTSLVAASTRSAVPAPPVDAVVPAKTKRSATRSAPLRSSSHAAYEKDVRLFKMAGGTIPCDVDALKKYIAKLRNKVAPTTLYRRAMAIRHVHLQIGRHSPTDDPAIRPLLRALQRGYLPSASDVLTGTIRADAPARRRDAVAAKPITRHLLLKMLDAIHRGSLDRRDKALLLLGFAGALKRAELVSLNVSDMTFTPDGLVITMCGRKLAISASNGPLCAVTAVREWITHAALDLEQPPGPLFRRFDRGGDPTPARLDAAWVSMIVKNRLKEVGIDPTPFSAQSLRRGRLLEAAKGVL